MMNPRITPQLLMRLGIDARQALVFAEPLASACTKFGIDSARRVAGFVAQCRHESSGFARLVEGLYYSTPGRLVAVYGRKRFPTEADAARFVGQPRALANRVYANRLGNGDEASGDGWRYRGRGLIQLTGRKNYAAAGAACAQPYLDVPDVVAEPADAALTAAWYWSAAGCNAMADRGDWAACTRAINGPAMLAAAERAACADECVRALT